MGLPYLQKQMTASPERQLIRPPEDEPLSFARACEIVGLVLGRGTTAWDSGAFLTCTVESGV